MAEGIDWASSLPPDAPLPPPAYTDLCERFVTGLRSALGEDLVSVYLYGAVTFPRPVDWSLDVDFHAVPAQPPPPAGREAVARLHRDLAERSQFGEELDGYYVLRSDAVASTPPTCVAGAFPSTGAALVAAPVDDAWALHRAHVLAGLRPPTWPELLDGLRAELVYAEDHPEHAAFALAGRRGSRPPPRHRDAPAGRRRTTHGRRAAIVPWAREAPGP